jgi:hypothetical protein
MTPIPKYSIEDIYSLTEELQQFGDCQEFCRYVLEGEFRRDLVDLRDSEDPISTALLNKADMLKGWKYSPIDKVTKYLYELPLREIPLNINHVSDPFKKYILRWRLETAQK